MSIRNFAAASLLAVSASILSAQSAQTIKGFISEDQCGAGHAAPSASITRFDHRSIWALSRRRVLKRCRSAPKSDIR